MLMEEMRRSSYTTAKTDLGTLVQGCNVAIEMLMVAALINDGRPSNTPREYDDENKGGGGGL